MRAPWASGPGEILQHGITLLRKDSDAKRGRNLSQRRDLGQFADSRGGCCSRDGLIEKGQEKPAVSGIEPDNRRLQGRPPFLCWGSQFQSV